MKQLSINGVALNFIEKNNEQECALIFLHGNSHSLRTFSAQMRAENLSPYRLVFVDLPGHGRSSKTKQYSVKIFAQILSEFISELKIKKFIIVGHSMGGHVGINLLTTKTLPLGLFLFGTPPLKNPFDVSAFKANSQAVALGKTDPTTEEISMLMDEMHYTGVQKSNAIEDFLSTDPTFRVDILNDVVSGKHEDEVELINSFTGEITFLLASQESMINNSYIEQENFLNLDQVHFREITAGHSPHIEKELDFNQNLADFCHQVFEDRNELKNITNGHQHERSQNEQRN